MKQAIIIVFDVGFGDAIYICIKEDCDNIKRIQSFLIDTGYTKQTRKCLKYLSNHNYDIENIILTHKHSDHIAGINEVLKDKRFHIKHIIMRGDDIIKSASQSNCKYLEHLCNEQKDIVVTDIFSTKAKEILKYFQILHPIQEHTEVHKNANKNSLVLALIINHNCILLMGDATINEENLILDYQKEKHTFDFAKVTHIKIGHHGSKTSTGDALKNELDENIIKFGIISCNYTKTPPPHEETLQHWPYNLLLTEKLDTTQIITQNVKFVL